MMTPLGAQKAVARMSLLKFFPADPEARAVLMEDLGGICENDEQADWLARRVLDLCREWPGVLTLWQIYFAKYPPRNARHRTLDQACGITEAFPNGVPSEKVESSRPALEGGREVLQLPAGAVVSADPEVDALVVVLAEEKSMPKAPTRKAFGPNAERVDKELRRMMGEYQNTERPPQVITEADFEAIRKAKVAEA